MDGEWNKVINNYEYILIDNSLLILIIQAEMDLSELKSVLVSPQNLVVHFKVDSMIRSSSLIINLFIIGNEVSVARTEIPRVLGGRTGNGGS
jgi:hypothetical protein